MSDDIFTLPAPPPDVRLAYGTGPNQFGDLRLPKAQGPFPVAMNIHGGYWRAKYDLAHAGHFCAALTMKGIGTWNVEYRRVGNDGGGWPATFEDIVSGYRFLSQIAKRYELDMNRVLVIGHSAGGQLAVCLAGHQMSVKNVVALAGVINLRRAWELHLSNDAVVAFLGGKPNEVPDHYREADPMQLEIPRATQWLIHGVDDDVVPPDFSQKYFEQKKKAGENVHLLEIKNAGHFELIDPRTAGCQRVQKIVRSLISSTGRR